MLLVCCVLFAQFVSTQALTLQAIKDIGARHAVENWGIEISPGAATRLIDLEIMRSGDADLSNSGEPHSVTTGPAGSSDGVLEEILPNYKVQNTVFVDGPPAPYGTLTASWRDGKQQEVGSYCSYYDIKGRPDKHLWVEVCDKVSWEDVYLVHKSIDCCMSFKIKKDRDRTILEYHTRCNADGRLQEVGSYNDTFVRTFKIQLYPINMRHCSDYADLSDSGEPVYIQARSEDLQNRMRVSACRHLQQGTVSCGFPASSSHFHGQVRLNYIWHERRACLLCDS